jgi:hypothetical protein
VVLFVVGQFLALWHEGESRHVTCAKHGEELEAPNLSSKLDTCGHSHWIGVEGGSAEHQDCAIARLLRTSAHAPDTTLLQQPIAVVPTMEALGLVAAARDVDVLLIAPKTSPPV